MAGLAGSVGQACHCALGGDGAGAVADGRGAMDGRPTAFHLQSGGASGRRLDKVMRWVGQQSHEWVTG